MFDEKWLMHGFRVSYEVKITLNALDTTNPRKTLSSLGFLIGRTTAKPTQFRTRAAATAFIQQQGIDPKRSVHKHIMYLQMYTDED